MAALGWLLIVAAVGVLLVVGINIVLERGDDNIQRVIAEWEAQRDAAPADSTYLDPHRGPGPVLVSPDEGDWMRMEWNER